MQKKHVPSKDVIILSGECVLSHTGAWQWPTSLHIHDDMFDLSLLNKI